MNNKLIRAIKRSELAYSHYVENKQYFQALRIYKANQKIYELLNEFIFSCPDQLVSDVINYIFHLEDWFEQFDQHSSGKQLSDRFVFDRMDYSIVFPSDFKQLII